MKFFVMKYVWKYLCHINADYTCLITLVHLSNCLCDEEFMDKFILEYFFIHIYIYNITLIHTVIHSILCT